MKTDNVVCIQLKYSLILCPIKNFTVTKTLGKLFIFSLICFFFLEGPHFYITDLGKKKSLRKETNGRSDTRTLIRYIRRVVSTYTYLFFPF